MENFNKYLIISPAEIEWGLYVNTLGYSSIPSDAVSSNTNEHTDKKQVLDDFYLVYITRGKGVFESSHTASTIIDEGTCFFLFPGIWHRYKPDLQTGWEQYSVGFNGRYAVELMEKHFLTPENPFIHTGLRDDLLQLFLNMISTVQMSVTGYPQIISGMMLQMLGLMHSFGKIQYEGSDKLIMKAKFIMRETIEKPVDLHEIARALPMGYSNFRKLFKKFTGLSPNQYYLDIRLNKSKELLLSTNLKIDQIAFQTGFSDVSYFSRLFKNKNGLTPGDYRSKRARKQTIIR